MQAAENAGFISLTSRPATTAPSRSRRNRATMMNAVSKKNACGSSGDRLLVAQRPAAPPRRGRPYRRRSIARQRPRPSPGSGSAGSARSCSDSAFAPAVVQEGAHVAGDGQRTGRPASPAAIARSATVPASAIIVLGSSVQPWPNQEHQPKGVPGMGRRVVRLQRDRMAQQVAGLHEHRPVPAGSAAAVARSTRS